MSQKHYCYHSRSKKSIMKNTFKQISFLICQRIKSTSFAFIFLDMIKSNGGAINRVQVGQGIQEWTK